ncbi:Hypothetical_protein [Hexamita inflata]|uniref:Hypothetical_protein n=1 Tax=Hexamita inflata TaxID=28002 RepID=A0AA86NVH2_9EUKA|nr:Hypothetical protein HINF_LOCUS14269 [Hexamita inflata]
MIKQQFIINFSNSCEHYGNSLEIIVEGSQGTFHKFVNLDYNRNGSCTLDCEDANHNSNCIDQLKALRKNIKMDLTFRGTTDQEKYYNVFVEVDTNNDGDTLGLIIGCSILGAAIIISIVIGFVVIKKKHKTVGYTMIGETTFEFI